MINNPLYNKDNQFEYNIFYRKYKNYDIFQAVLHFLYKNRKHFGV